MKFLSKYDNSYIVRPIVALYITILLLLINKYYLEAIILGIPFIIFCNKLCTIKFIDVVYILINIIIYFILPINKNIQNIYLYALIQILVILIIDKIILKKLDKID